MLYKYWTENFQNIPENLDALTRIYGNIYFKNGKYNGKYGVYCLKSLDSGSGDYGSPRKSSFIKDSIFWPPSKLPDDIGKFIKDNESDSSAIRVNFKLESGYTLNIIPATAEPRKVFISMFGDDDDIGEFTSEYGKLAYDIDYKLGKEEEVTYLDCFKLIGLAIEKSYKLNLDIINWLSIISQVDIEPLTYTILGYRLQENIKKKEDHT